MASEGQSEPHPVRVLMAGEGAACQLTRDLKASISSIVQGHGTGPPVTDESAELHGLCACLERLLQFDQKEQRGFLRARRDYWDFLCEALCHQRGDTEPVLFVRSQHKLRTPLGRGRAFIRFCLAHQQLAENLQLCLLDPSLIRDWYGPRSPLLHADLRQDLLDTLYALNGVAFHLDLECPDLDAAWPLFSESHRCDPNESQAQKPRKTKGSPKQMRKPRRREVRFSTHQREEIPAAPGDPREGHLGEPHLRQDVCLQDAPGEAQPAGHTYLPPSWDKKSLGATQATWGADGETCQRDPENRTLGMDIHLGNSMANIQGRSEGVIGALKVVTRAGAEDRGAPPEAERQGSPGGTRGARTAEVGHFQRLSGSSPGRTEKSMPGSRQEGAVPSTSEPQILEFLGAEEDTTPEKPQERADLSRKEASQDVVESLRRDLQEAQEQAQHQQRLLEGQQGQLEALRGQLSRSRAELEQERREAARSAEAHQEELGAQRELVSAMKRRVLELTREKDALWQQLQHVASMVPGCCVVCSKVFGRLSRRYACSVCRGLLCHACSSGYKARGRRCPPCAQKGEAPLL